MSFDERDIRPSMDVYTRDEIYLGSIRKVIPGVPSPDGARVPAAVRQASESSGERLGPVPTQPIGNRGPEIQSAARLYAVTRDDAQVVGRGAIVVGKWWGLVGRKTIPLDAVLSFSMERVTLALDHREVEQRIS